MGFLRFSSLLGSLGSSEKRSGLAWSWFGLDTVDPSGTALCITALVLQVMLVPIAHLCFLPPSRLRKAGDPLSTVQEHNWWQYVTLLCVSPVGSWLGVWAGTWELGVYVALGSV